MCSDDVYTPSAYSRNEVEPQICTILMKDVPGPSSETCNWAMSVKVEEEDPLAIPFPSVKTEPGMCTDILKDEPGFYSESCVTSHDGNQAIDVKFRKDSDIEEDDGPVAITFPALKPEHEIEFHFLLHVLVFMGPTSGSNI
ncbi:uncharacterized protein LOC111865960 isoform X5 [Cryptotermes secundus]|uniref:uncharacterized protein LOC111865960 isoform X5 n=1 Tax=Cryptotermes secundus TaxID=105785 RepID=UPI001454E42F|nr:uncharacterized protein LOC111865960 isoform X5 [Cryptotermes secundus]